VLVCIIFFSLLTSCKNQEDKAEKYFARGNALFAQKDYVKARLEYKNAARISPTNPKVIYSLGLVEEAQGNITQALKAFLVAEQQDGNYAPAISKLVHYFMAAQQYEEVTKRIDHLLSIDPTNATAYAIKGSLFLKSKEYDEARVRVQKALNIDPANVIAYSVLAGIHNAQSEPEKAISALKKGIERNPKEVSLHLLMAAIYSENNDTLEVIKIYHKLFDLYPKETKFHFDLATVLSETGYTDKAELELRKVVKLFPDNIIAKHKLAIFLENNRDANAAEKEIQSYIEKQPKDKTPYIWLADLYIRNNKDLLAIETLSSLINNNADDQISMNASTSLANIQLRKGDIDIARQLIDSVLEKNVNNKEALFIRANLSFYQGNYQQAVSDLRTVIRDDIKTTKAHRVLAEIFLIQGHTNLAIDTLIESLKTNASELSSHVRLAQLYSLQGDDEHAMELLDIVTKTDPIYPIGWENTARLAIEKEKWDTAKEAIQRLEKLDGQKLIAEFLRGQIFDKTKEYGQARALYKNVIKADPSSPLSEYVLSALLDISQKEGDLQDIKEFLYTLQTNSPTVETILAIIWESMGEKENAEKHYIKATENNPKTQVAYIAYAKLLIEKGNDDAALEILSKAEKAIPFEIAASLEKANFLSQLGKTDEAIAIYEALYQKNDQTNIVANNMAQLIADYKSHDNKAMDRARIAAERFTNSNNPYHLDTLGWVYLRMGHIAQAQSVLERAISLSPVPLHPQIGYHYGSLLAKIGRNEEAIEFLTQSLSEESVSYPGIDEAKALLNALKE
jgi:tetratricopeptide (TPR) repeat protein